MIPARSASELEPRYYLRHFETLLAHVEALYPTLLQPAERDFINCVRTLSEPAGCLYVRLINRRPDFFRVARLDYPEIPDLKAASAELQQAGLIEPLGLCHAPESRTVLTLFTVGELRRWVTPVPGRLSKPALIDWLIAEHGAALIEAISEPVIRRLGMEPVRVLKLLFFGTLHRDMDQFVIRDLGHARFETVEPARLTPYFRTRAQVEAKLAVYAANERFIEQRQDIPAARIADDYLDWHAGFGEPDPLIAPSLQRLTLKVARHIERHGEPERALDIYRLTERPPSRERQVRLLAKAGREGEALALCERITAAPINAAEAGFARDRLARRDGERRRAVTRMLAEADQLVLDARWRSCVELGVLENYRQQGWQGAFTENLPWRGLFGLLFWDLLFDPAAGALHHPLQRAPSDLFRPEFFELRRVALEQRLRLLDDRETLLVQLQAMIEAKRGISNPLVVWTESLPLLIERCCELLTPDQLREMLRTMARDPGANGSGFPDLLVWKANDYCLIEVKSPTDRLSAQQLFWLERLRSLGVAAKVLRVRWEGRHGSEPAVPGTRTQN